MNGKKLNVITLFSGYDSQCLALNRLGVDYDLLAWSEIDNNAVKAHDTLFPQWADRNLGDVSKIDWQATNFGCVDLLTYGNSIVVNVLYHIFRRLLTETEAEQGQQLSIF